MKVLYLIILLLLLASCSYYSYPAWHSTQIVETFEKAGLEVGEYRPMTQDDYGLAPLLAVEGTRFYISSLGEGKGGRIMSFNTPDDLAKVEAYYVNAGKASALLY